LVGSSIRHISSSSGGGGSSSGSDGRVDIKGIAEVDIEYQEGEANTDQLEE